MYQVYVLSQTGKPLMPTTRFGRIKGLLKSKQAKVVNKKPFTIQLQYNSTEFTQPLTLGIDTGTNYIGAVVTNEKSEIVFVSELTTRTQDIPKLMKSRLEYRRSRRHHQRKKRQRRAINANTTFKQGQKVYSINGCEKDIICHQIKPKRIKFENRQRKEGWLTPTANHLLQTHIHFIEKITQILPIKKIMVEYAQFDIALMMNPEIKGKSYQEGILKGVDNTIAYVLSRDKHTCQCCHKKTGLMHVHHVIWKRDNGSNSPENLVTVCEHCHDKIHTNEKVNTKMVTMFKGVKKRFVHTTLLNSIMPSFYQWCEHNFKHVEKTYGYETKQKRRLYSLEKSHVMDAFLISIGNKSVKNTEIDLEIRYKYYQFRRQNRANIQRQEDRKYYFEGKKIANNRHKRTGQCGDSLEDVIKREGIKITHQLTVKSATRPKRRQNDIGRGDMVRYKGGDHVVKGVMGQYVGFMDKEKYNIPIKKVIKILNNQGMVCL